MNDNIEDTFRIVGLLEAIVNQSQEIENHAQECNGCGRWQCCCEDNNQIYGNVARKMIKYIQKIERILLQNENTNEEIIRMREMRGRNRMRENKNEGSNKL